MAAGSCVASCLEAWAWPAWAFEDLVFDCLGGCGDDVGVWVGASVWGLPVSRHRRLLLGCHLGAIRLHPRAGSFELPYEVADHGLKFGWGVVEHHCEDGAAVGRFVALGVEQVADLV